MQKVKFNLNDYIKVKISDEGIEHCVHNHNKIMPIRLHTSFKELKKRADKDGYYTVQMHSFIDDFGGQGFRLGQLLDINIYLLKKDIEPVLTNAKLITTAPELLEALILVLDTWGEDYKDKNNPEGGGSPLWEKVNSVIKKATE